MRRAKDIKSRVDQLMGAYAGAGVGPTEAAEAINAEFGTTYTPREVWNLWIGDAS